MQQQLYEEDRAERVKAFKNELKSYKQLKRDYRYYSEQCMFYQNKLYNCGSPDLSNDIRIYYDPMTPDPRFDWQDKLDYFNSQAKTALNRITNVEFIMSMLSDDDKKIISEVYFKGKTYDELWNPYSGVSVRMMKYQVDKAIWNAIKEVGKQYIDGEIK